MDILHGCVFIDTAKILNKVGDKKFYDWENKLNFVLSSDLIDKLIYFIDFNLNSNTLSNLTLDSKGKIFILESKGNSYIYQLTSSQEKHSGELSLASLYGLSSLLKRAKLKIYGWA